MCHGVDRKTKAGVIDAETAPEVAETMQALSTLSRVRIPARHVGVLPEEATNHVAHLRLDYPDRPNVPSG